ncbi:hypothetical protein DBR06_SOUSAS18210004, partial [Sousa chinensis]
YKESYIYRKIAGFSCQGGNFTCHNDSSGKS